MLQIYILLPCDLLIIKMINLLYMWNSIKVLIFKWHTTDQEIFKWHATDQANITLVILVI